MFDLSKSGAHLLNIKFGSRPCTDIERRCHSFLGEVACGLWAIAQNITFLWGTHFYWICDYITMKEILDYNGNVSMVYCWAQKLLGYHFSILHQSK